MRRSLSVLALLCSACGTAQSGGPEYQDPLSALNQVVSVDLDAADAIAVGHNDVIAHACFPVLKKYLGTATPSTDQIKGVISTFEKARVTRLAIEGQVAGGIPTDLKMGCAPLLMDERLFLIRLGLLAAGQMK